MSMVGEDPKHEQSPKWREIDAIRKGKSDLDLAEQIWRLKRSCADLHAQLTDMQGEVHRVEAMRSSEAPHEALELLRRVRKANVIFPSLCANNMEAYNLLDEIDKFLASQSDTNSR